MPSIDNWKLWIWKSKRITYLIKQQDDYDYSIVDKIYLHVKDPSEAKYQYLIKKCEKMVLILFKFKVFY